MTAYYNEHDDFAADWLRNLIKAGLIADGEVDTRSIVDVRPDDVRGFDQCHFFAGIGGWSYALRKAGWDDSRPAWTGSCPCQPFSLAGAQRGFADERHLWPVWRDLVEVVRPPVVFGEQVASATQWLGLVRGDLEALGYAVGALPIQAASAAADHLRDRYWFVGNRESLSKRKQNHEGNAISTSREARPVPCGTSGDGPMAHAVGQRGRGRDDQRQDAEHAHTSSQAFVTSGDGKRRPIKPGIRLLAHGIPNRVGLLRGFGNAIDPRPAAAFIEAYMTVQRSDRGRETP